MKEQLFGICFHLLIFSQLNIFNFMSFSIAFMIIFQDISHHETCYHILSHFNELPLFPMAESVAIDLF